LAILNSRGSAGNSLADFQESQSYQRRPLAQDFCNALG